MLCAPNGTAIQATSRLWGPTPEGDELDTTQRTRKRASLLYIGGLRGLPLTVSHK